MPPATELLHGGRQGFLGDYAHGLCRSGTSRPTTKDERWHNRVSGQETPNGGSYNEKAEAVAAGRLLAVYRAQPGPTRPSEHIIKRIDGTIEDRQTYPRSADPRNIPG